MSEIIQAKEIFSILAVLKHIWRELDDFTINHVYLKYLFFST